MLHLPSPSALTSLSLASPSNIQMVQEAPDSLISVRNTECVSATWPGLAETVANRSPVARPSQCQVEDVAPHSCDGNSLLGPSNDRASCSSMSSESTDSDSTDRHKDMAFT
jgi:hypothetical protein